MYLALFTSFICLSILYLAPFTSFVCLLYVIYLVLFTSFVCLFIVCLILFTSLGFVIHRGRTQAVGEAVVVNPMEPAKLQVSFGGMPAGGKFAALF